MNSLQIIEWLQNEFSMSGNCISVTVWRSRNDDGLGDWSSSYYISCGDFWPLGSFMTSIYPTSQRSYPTLLRQTSYCRAVFPPFVYSDQRKPNSFDKRLSQPFSEQHRPHNQSPIFTHNGCYRLLYFSSSIEDCHECILQEMLCPDGTYQHT